MARPKSAVKAEELVQAPNQEADVHHMWCKLQTTETSGTNSLSVDEVDQKVRVWLQAGYRLITARPFETDPAGVKILYVFVKD